MQTLLFYALKTIIYSAIFFGYYCLALRNKRFHFYNRFYLLLTVLLSLLLPVIHLQLWQWNSKNAQVIKLLNVANVYDSEVVVSSNSFSFNWVNGILILYCAIVLGLLLAAAFSVMAIFRLKAKYNVEKIESINFINTDLEQSPFSFFNNLFWKNTLSLTDDAGKQIFKHELTHIEQNHSFDKLLMRIITSLFWFNPLYWFAQKELSLIHEFIADEKAVENKSAEAFALMILQSQYTKSIFSPAQSFHYSPIKRRLLMLTTSKKPSFSYARRIFVLPLLAITVLLFAFKLKNEEQGAASIHTNAPFVLVVDAGHGGTEFGASGSDNINEKDINLSIAKTIEKLAPEYGIQVKLTRTEDITVPLQDRMSYLKTVQPDAFISLHVNAVQGTHTDKSGMEVYISRVDSNTNFTKSKLLGSSIVKNLQSNFITNDLLLQRKEQGIYVIDANPYPAILIECGYMNNDNDLKLLTDNAKKEQLARDILKGVVAYANADKNASSINNNSNEEATQSSSDTAKKPVPLYIVDGKEMSAEEVNNIDKNKIESVNVLKGIAATKQYGDKGKNGVVIIKLKNNDEMSLQKQKASGNTENNSPVIKTDKAAPLYIVDGKEMSEEEVHKIDNTKISSVNVLKGAEATKQYSDKGKNGVIEIQMKKNSSQQPVIYFQSPEIKNRDNGNATDSISFSPPEANGSTAWITYSNKNSNVGILTKTNAPKGKYTVIVSFKVAEDGTISNIKADNDPGYGIGAEAVRVIQQASKWVPEKKDGDNTANVKQAVTFQVENKKL